MTKMQIEGAESPSVIRKQLIENNSILSNVAKIIKKRNIPFCLTVGRGSSDHAATFAKYLFETRLGLVTASAAPSVTSIYKSKLRLKDSLVISISQSGQSSDICDVIAYAKKSGAITVSFVNDVTSPLAYASEYVIPLMAREELSVAATKSFIASISSIIQLVTHLTDDIALKKALEILPESLDSALQSTLPPELLSEMSIINDIIVLGRGFGYPLAQEAALKLKETCSIHAEAISGAEILHGPFALMKENFPFIMLCQSDNTLEGMIKLAVKIKTLKGKIFLFIPSNILKTNIYNSSSIVVKLPKSIHPICDPILFIHSFYRFASNLSLHMGFNPDEPPNIFKVTNTI